MFIAMSASFGVGKNEDLGSIKEIHEKNDELLTAALRFIRIVSAVVSTVTKLAGLDAKSTVRTFRVTGFACNGS
jgi:hypothetical protein